jgi:universal stress protein family protein
MLRTKFFGSELARSCDALETAAVLAETFDAELLVAHVAEIGDAADVPREFEVWIEPHLRSRCRYSQIVASGDAAAETLRLANDAAADLIVVGAQHKRFTDLSVLGTTTQRVVRFARRPVLSVTMPRVASATRIAVASWLGTPFGGEAKVSPPRIRDEGS